MNIPLIGALAFGVLIGWYTYYINRYRRGDVQFSDLVTLIGIIGGGTVLSLFDKNSDLFGAYAIGLLVGFTAYFICLITFVRRSDAFSFDWFLDGRRKNPPSDSGFGNDRGSGTGMESPRKDVV